MTEVHHHKTVALLLKGYVLTTAEILYRMPDHRTILQTFIWQELDLAPKYPHLEKFLAFWEAKLDAPLHSVRVAHSGLVIPADLKYYEGRLIVH